jgi:hypothetical protein
LPCNYAGKLKACSLKKWQIQSGGDNSSTSAASRKPGVDKRRRI